MLFCGYLWSPILEHTTEILEELNKTYKVSQYFLYDFKDNKAKHDEAVLKIYTTDDIAQEKVKNVKLTSMAPYPHKFVYFLFDIPDPKYRTKAGFNTKISTIVEAIKKQLRGKYMSRVKNYIHDIIIHVSDNEAQTSQIAEIMKSYQTYKKHEFMNLKTFLRYQYDGELFTRADMLVRKYSIEQYLKNKDYDFALYTKMQSGRGALGTHNAKKFKTLIESLETSTFDVSNPILYEGKYRLRDGSHRLSWVYHNRDIFVPCGVWDKKLGPGFIDYGINMINGVDKKEREAIQNELDLLKNYVDDKYV